MSQLRKYIELSRPEPTLPLLRVLRRVAGYTLRRVAKESGYSIATISNYEKAKQVPTMFAYQAVLNTLGFELVVNGAPFKPQLLTQLRMNNGYSQEHIAQRVQCCPATIQRFECGDGAIKYNRALAWLKACDADITVSML